MYILMILPKCKLQINLQALWSKNQPQHNHTESMDRQEGKPTFLSINSTPLATPRNRDWSPANLRDNVVRPTWQDLEAPLKCKRILRLRRALLLGKHGRTLISKILLHLSLEGLAFKLTRRFSHFTDFCCIVLLSLEPRLTHLICLRSLKLEIFVPCFQLTLEDAGKCQESCYDFLISPH